MKKSNTFRERFRNNLYNFEDFICNQSHVHFNEGYYMDTFDLKHMAYFDCNRELYYKKIR